MAWLKRFVIPGVAQSNLTRRHEGTKMPAAAKCSVRPCPFDWLLAAAAQHRLCVSPYFISIPHPSTPSPIGRGRRRVHAGIAEKKRDAEGVGQGQSFVIPAHAGISLHASEPH